VYLGEAWREMRCQVAALSAANIAYLLKFYIESMRADRTPKAE